MVVDTTSEAFLPDLAVALKQRNVGVILANTIMRCAALSGCSAFQARPPPSHFASRFPNPSVPMPQCTSLCSSCPILLIHLHALDVLLVLLVVLGAGGCSAPCHLGILTCLLSPSMWDQAHRQPQITVCGKWQNMPFASGLGCESHMLSHMWWLLPPLCAQGLLTWTDQAPSAYHD